MAYLALFFGEVLAVVVVRLAALAIVDIIVDVLVIRVETFLAAISNDLHDLNTHTHQSCPI